MTRGSHSNRLRDDERVAGGYLGRTLTVYQYCSQVELGEVVGCDEVKTHKSSYGDTIAYLNMNTTHPHFTRYWCTIQYWNSIPRSQGISREKTKVSESPTLLSFIVRILRVQL